MNKEDVLKIILLKLQDDSIKPISDILNEIGLDTDLAESYESLLKNRGFIKCSKQGCFLRPVGKAYLHGISDDYFHTKEDFNIEDYHEEASLTVDEIIDYLKNAELEREILFEEIQELK